MKIVKKVKKYKDYLYHYVGGVLIGKSFLPWLSQYQLKRGHSAKLPVHVDLHTAILTHTLHSH